MDQPRLCLLTQTPYARFLPSPAPRPEGAPLARYREGVDYAPSPGGVTRMMEALLGRWTARRRVRGVSWISLSSEGPARAMLARDVALEHVRLPARQVPRYGEAKAAVWDALHGLSPGLDAEAAEDGLALLADAFAARARSLHARDPFDAFYVHDFQLLPLAPRLPRGPPRVLRWHVPVQRWPSSLRRLVVKHLACHDDVVVSTRGYADALVEAGLDVPVHASYPYLDVRRHARVVTPEETAAFEARWGLAPDEPVFLLVARLDPMKSQDVALRALSRLPRGKLLLVGGGGFSAGTKGGLGLSFAARWKEHLEGLARDLGVAHRVVFTGTIPDAELEVAYRRADALLLPSRLEGFGLAAIEGWLHGLPVLVSSGAGVHELVTEGEDGFVHAPGDDAALAEGLARLLDDPSRGPRMGRRGRVAARACDVARRADEVWGILRARVESARAAQGAGAEAWG